MFAQAIASLLQDLCTPEAIRAIEQGGSPAALSTPLEASGFQELLAPPDAGGGGAGWADFHRVVTLCGGYALPLPLAQTMAARALVTGQALPAGWITFAPWMARQGDGSLRADQVPFGRSASHVLGLVGGDALLLPLADARAQAHGVHGSLAASLRWAADAGTPLALAVPGTRVQALAAAIHASLLAGAMKKVFDMAMGYANERAQFGKPIGKFQAIQHQLSVMAEHVAAASIAAEAAFHAQDEGLPSFAACAAAKARTSEAAQLVASTAHAVHGAIGVTEEYDLQLYTRRLHEWRVADGSELYWGRALGELWVQRGEVLFVDAARAVFA